MEFVQRDQQEREHDQEAEQDLGQLVQLLIEQSDLGLRLTCVHDTARVSTGVNRETNHRA